MLAVTSDSLLGKTPIDALEATLGKIAESSLVPASRIQEALITGWEQAVDHFLEDGQLDDSEEELLNRFRTHFSLSPSELDDRGAYSRLVKGEVLRDVMHGVVPERLQVQETLPFHFQKTEKLIWLLPDTKYYEERKRRQYVGGYRGMSFRIAKGMYYRTGGFKGHPVETSETVFVGSGLLAVTTRHLYFTGGGKSFRIRHEKIVSIEPFSDGVAIQRDAQTARPQLFATGDGWFTYNLLMNVSNL